MISKRSRLASDAHQGIVGLAHVVPAVLELVADHAVAALLVATHVVAAVATDSMDLYGSRLEELRESEGPYREIDAAVDYNRYLLGESVDNMLELSYHDRKRIHNLKYYTWVEQQGRSYEEIQAQWYDDDYWTGIPANLDRIDALIDAFNVRVGLLGTS